MSTLANVVASRRSAVASSYLINETFEGDGIPEGWVANGTVNWGDTATPLSGTKSLSITGYSTNQAAFNFSQSYNDLWIYMQWRGSTSSYPILELRDNSEAQLAFQNRSDMLRVHHGSAIDAIGSYELITASEAWFHYVAQSGGGGNGIVTAYIRSGSITGVRPVSPSINLTTGNGGAVDRLWLEGPSTTPGTWFYDNIKVSTTEIF